MTDSKNKPAVNVYTKVFNQNGESKIGSQIGVGFGFKEGKEGYNLILDAQPIPNSQGRIELVIFPTKE